MNEKIPPAETGASIQMAPEPKPKFTSFQKEVIVINLICIVAGIAISMLVAFEVVGPKPGAALVCFLTASWGFGVMHAARLF